MDFLAPLKRLVTATFAAEYNNGNSGAAATINFANGQKQRVMLTANTTLTISAPPGVGNYQLRMIQDGTGDRTVTFSGISASRWLGSDVQPPINTAADAETLVSFYFDGTNFLQSMAKVGAA